MIALLLSTLACVPDAPAPADPNRIPADDPAVDALREEPSDPSAQGFSDEADREDHRAVRRALLVRMRAQEALARGDVDTCVAVYRAGAEAEPPSERAPRAAARTLLETGARACAALSPAPAAGSVVVVRAEPAAGCGDAWVRWGAWVAGDTTAPAPSVTHSRDATPAASAAAWMEWATCSDPFAPSDLLGPWRGDLAERTLRALADARASGAPDAGLDLPARLRVPSEALAKAEPVGIDAALLGTLPSNDVMVDLGGVPFATTPRRLARMDVSDPAHRAYLEVQAQYLVTVAPSELPAQVSDVVLRYDRMGHTSRWYNRAALRQAAARSLASRGAWRPAARVLSAEERAEGPAFLTFARIDGLRLLEARLLLWLRDPGAASRIPAD
jgi:hypothetical protein